MVVKVKKHVVVCLCLHSVVVVAGFENRVSFVLLLCIKWSTLFLSACQIEFFVT